MKPAWTDKVEKGMWLIVARSSTVLAAEISETYLGKEDTDYVLAASRYAQYHWSKHGKGQAEDINDDQ